VVVSEQNPYRHDSYTILEKRYREIPGSIPSADHAATFRGPIPSPTQFWVVSSPPKVLDPGRLIV
jgi:hypothetical protein